MLSIFCIIFLFAHTSFATGPATEFAFSVQEETSLWQQQVQKFLADNPQAQLLTHESLQALFLPAKTSDAPLFILSSGIHGAEAYAGGALQRLFLQQWQLTPRTSGLLMIHILNPHGFSHFRRTNAYNVDLNRNFFVEPLPNNQEYRNMQTLLEPNAPASTSFLSKWNFFVKVGWYYLMNGKKSILNTLAGQSHAPKGLYFSGTETQAETVVVQNWILQIAKDFSTVLHIDLHTGFGERGKLHFYGSEDFRQPEQIKSLQKVFPHVRIDTAHNADFYPTHGNFIDWTWKALPEKKIIPMVFEFGTKDSQTLLGGMESFWISVIENQGFHFGYKTDEDKQNTRVLFESLFNPQDEAWRRAVLEQGQEALTEALRNLEKN